jgi:hypothetical protein
LRVESDLQRNRKLFYITRNTAIAGNIGEEVGLEET